MTRPFELDYNPYTQRVTVLDRPATLERAVHEIGHHLDVIRSAIGKMDRHVFIDSNN
jgi:Biopterin-dependent aromatic amino acid hydroxylase